MSQFRLLARTRQVTEYSCGACALQAVMSYWGKNIEETELMKALQTTSEEGTYPENIVRGAQSLGFEAEARDHLSLEEVEQFTAEGAPMIALVQAWRSEKRAPEAVTEEWDNGHYIVVLGVDKAYVYFQDPFARMSKGFMPRDTFVAHWHQVMGGDLKKNPKLMQLGIFVRGRNAASRHADTKASLSELDFAKFGSLEFDGNEVSLRNSTVRLPQRAEGHLGKGSDTAERIHLPQKRQVGQDFRNGRQQPAG